MRTNKSRSKMVALVLALVMILCVAVGGTLAWLTASTTETVNTFSYGDLGVDLKETTGNDYTIVPGVDIKKDPKASLTVPEGAVAVDTYLFVQVVEENWPANSDTGNAAKISYTVDTSNWTEVSGAGVKGKVYCYKNKAVAAASVATTTDISILTGDKITVSGELTKSEVDALMQKGAPKLTFKAFAVQAAGSDSVAAAWAKVSANAIQL